ncbi:PLP-dependent aminotransferase family protein [Streptomyces otsuchiensis]|uniref:MocR-like pyridoxine biosynthesis transcription factor PdxR n=1 Tax=Streptomyces otsuchiensis TaxID=2681388 RepID=UPI001031DD22|nr:PLP-dependent aminotransferase family protein [Streptomyces otsuchiensis]
MTGSDFLHLDPGDAPPRGRTAWLVQELREAIAGGALAPGTRLPASRVLAGDLSVARGTVVEAYRRLAEEGLLITNRGGGTEVARFASAPAAREALEAEPPPRALLNISAGVPDLSAFPRAAWLRAERRVLSTATSHDLGYTDPQGVPQLRAALARWLARSRGVTAAPERIIVTAGVTGALSLLAQVLRDRGVAECATEDPGAEGNRRILGYWLDALHPIPVGQDGMDVAALARTGARAVLVTPAHQFPTGVVLSPARRRELIAWAERRNGIVIEDDYDSEYRYDRAPVRALHAAAPERIVHVSSLSKVLAPGLRAGWMIAPACLHEELVRKRWATDQGSPALPQLALAELIDTGVLERHLRGLRLRHRERRDAAVAAIRHHLPGCRVEGIAAGLHLLVWLPGHVDDTAVAARAEEAGIAVQPLSAHRHAPGPPGLIIGYGPHPAARLDAAIQTIGSRSGLSSA